MPLYEWKCVRCGFVCETFEQSAGACPQCGDRMKRKYSVAVKPMFHAHFNWSVGEYVTSMQDFKDKLSRKGDAQSERLGIEHRYRAVDHGDKEALGIQSDDVRDIL